jgi:hypothetical protein
MPLEDGAVGPCRGGGFGLETSARGTGARKWGVGMRMSKSTPIFRRSVLGIVGISVHVARAGVEPASPWAPGFEPGVVTNFTTGPNGEAAGPREWNFGFFGDSWRTSGLYRSIATVFTIANERKAGRQRPGNVPWGQRHDQHGPLFCGL